MHNIDRTVGGPNYEYNNETYEMNPETYEYQGEFENENEFLNELNGETYGETGGYSGETNHEMNGLSGEAMEMELATELLGVSNEAELEQFLGKLVRRAAGAVKSFAKSTAGQAIGGILKSAAKTALPLAGRALGTAFGGPVGGMIGGKLGSYASNLFEMELEGLSNEDKEFELAKAYVRFANNAVRGAARNPQFSRYPRQVAKTAVIASARRYAPGLLRSRASYGRNNYRTAPAYAANNYNSYNSYNGSEENSADEAATSGTWYKQGNQLVINLQEAQ